MYYSSPWSEPMRHDLLQGARNNHPSYCDCYNLFIISHSLAFPSSNTISRSLTIWITSRTSSFAARELMERNAPWEKWSVPAPHFLACFHGTHVFTEHQITRKNESLQIQLLRVLLIKVTSYWQNIKNTYVNQNFPRLHSWYSAALYVCACTDTIIHSFHAPTMKQSS